MGVLVFVLGLIFIILGFEVRRGAGLFFLFGALLCAVALVDIGIF